MCCPCYHVDVKLGTDSKAIDHKINVGLRENVEN